MKGHTSDDYSRLQHFLFETETENKGKLFKWTESLQSTTCLNDV